MKHFLKGILVIAIVMGVLMVINIFCNTHDIHLDPAATGTIAAICSILFYHALIKNEK